VSAPPLPDDPARWPDDPHELLGVPRTAGPRDLRRAYTRLIRTYKPEQFPEQFRRIRAAYETALRLAEFFGTSPGSPELLPAPRPLDPADDADALWELAVRGDEGRAYAALADLHRRRPDRPDLPLRLYWLLALRPDLDPDRTPAAWLAAALRAGGLTGPALELYRQELDERPAEALAATERLLGAPAPPERLADVAEGRWRAAARLKRWDVLRADLDVLRERVRPLDEPAWLRVQLAALDHLAWAAGTPGAGELFASCRRELDGLGHLAVRFPDAFDRLDYLLAATAGWRAARDEAGLPADLLELLPRAWVGPFAAVRPLLLRVLEQVGAAPRAWLRHLDALERHSSAALAQLGGLLAQYQDRQPGPPPIPHTPQELARLAQGFFTAEGPQRYAALRPKVLTFCLQEAVGPELLAAVVPPDWPADGPGGPTPLAAALANDWPLRAVCWACRLFWA
jgi:hypothetical protein